MARNETTRKIGLIATTALASLALAGCATQGGSAPLADASANKAQAALAKGDHAQAIAHAEAAVLAEPRNAAYRAVLGATYMEAGRFQAAATSFADSIELGNESPKVALSLALAETAAGYNESALDVLGQWEGSIDAADLGLAYALAGDAQRGVHVLTNVLRAGRNDAKVRQNLAYAYALQGNWRAARLMAAEDVPADQLDARIAEWANMAKPEDQHRRVASLLSVPVVADPGQPMRLALNNTPGDVALAQATVDAPVSGDYAYAVDGELPPVGAAPVAVAAAPVVPAPLATAPTYAPTYAPAPAPVVARAPVPAPAPAPAVVAPQPKPAAPGNFARAFAEDPSPMARPMAVPVAKPAPKVAAAPKRSAPSSSEVTRVAAKPVPNGTHLVQLGSFGSQARAEKAWDIYLARDPSLSDRDLVITKARVRGKTYYRVSAAGFTAASAKAMCGAVKSRGEGCYAWAEGKPMPGAVDSGTRLARR